METRYQYCDVPTQVPTRHDLNLESFIDDPELRCVEYCMKVLDELSVDWDKPTCEEFVRDSHRSKLRVVNYLLERMKNYAEET